MKKYEMRFDLCLTGDELNLLYDKLINADLKGAQAPMMAMILGKIADAAKSPTYVDTSAPDANASTQEEPHEDDGKDTKGTA